MVVWTSASGWDTFNLCWLVLRANAKPFTANVHGGAKQKQTLMVQGWSCKKLFCELLVWLRLREISIVFGLILGCVYCAAFWLLGVTCVSKQVIRYSNWRWFHPGAAVLSLALKIAKLSTATPASAVFWLPSRGQYKQNPGSLSGSKGNAFPGHWLIPETYVNSNRHYLLTTGAAAAFLSTLGPSHTAAKCCWGKWTQPQLLLDQNMHLSLLGFCKNLLKKADEFHGEEGGSAGCTDECQLSVLYFREFHCSKCIHKTRLQCTGEEPLRRSFSLD